MTAAAPPPPQDCETMDDVRQAIDYLDRQIVKLLAERQGYVEAAGRIKPHRGQVRDEARVEDVIAKALRQAETSGAHPALVEMLYRVMVEWFITHEYQVFDAHRPQ